MVGSGYLIPFGSGVRPLFHFITVLRGLVGIPMTRDGLGGTEKAMPTVTTTDIGMDTALVVETAETIVVVV